MLPGCRQPPALIRLYPADSWYPRPGEGNVVKWWRIYTFLGVKSKGRLTNRTASLPRKVAKQRGDEIWICFIWLVSSLSGMFSIAGFCPEWESRPECRTVANFRVTERKSSLGTILAPSNNLHSRVFFDKGRNCCIQQRVDVKRWYRKTNGVAKRSPDRGGELEK